MKSPESVLRFVKGMKRAMVLVSCVVIPAFMVCAVFAFAGYMAFWILAPVLLVAYLALYGWYALHFSMGTVVRVEVTSEVVHVTTKRATHTYDATRGCVRVRKKGRRYIATFRTQDAEDTFTFYAHAPFSKPYEEGFSEEDIASFFRGEIEEG